MSFRHAWFASVVAWVTVALFGLSTFAAPPATAAGPVNVSFVTAWGSHGSANGQFDDNVLAGFVRSVGVYPVGTLVRLESERLALVIDQGRGDTLRPVVRAFYCIRSRVRIPSHDVDLARADAGEGIVSREEPRKWGFANWETHWAAMIRGKA